MSFKNLLIAVCFCLLLVSATLAEVPQMINYQGKITTPEGHLIGDTAAVYLTMRFSIYADSEGVIDPLWTETQNSVRVEYGIFSVLLGDVNNIPNTVFTGDIRYLGVKVGDDPEMTPRKSIVSTAYAYNSDMLDGYSSETFLSPMIPINKVVRGLVHFDTGNDQITQTLSSQIDPSKSIVVLRDNVNLYLVKSLTSSEITIAIHFGTAPGPIDIGYQIIEYK